MTQDSNIHHSSGEEFLDPRLEEKLRALQAVPARNPAAAQNRVEKPSWNVRSKYAFRFLKAYPNRPIGV